jgi:CHAT domain-containing protein
VRYAPSLTVLRILEERRYIAEKRPLLALGGAVYEEISYDESLVESGEQLAALRKSTAAALSRGLGVKKTYHRLGYGKWENLPGTLTEVSRIGELAPEAKVLSAFEVDESVIKRMSDQGELKRYGVVHFATHGLVVPQVPELSALVLSQLNNRSDGEDGYLRMDEIAQLDLEADFVNLSACETGLGKIYGGEGVVGLTQSFLVGGANGLSVSLWQVADESTMEFMVGLYRLVYQQGMPYSRAITEMKRRFVNSSRYSSPFFWAPFVYYGK